MTREEKQKALYALKKSAPIMAMTPNEFADYIKTLNKMADWLEQEPKTGHWIKVIDEVNEYGNKTCHHECSECGSGKSGWGEYNYCPDCGCRMIEPQESEDKK